MTNFKNKFTKYNKKNADLENQINMRGGLCVVDQTYEYDNLESILSYIRNRHECTNNIKTTNKYFVILYGPPASGKQVARKLACKFIKKIFNESSPVEDIFKSFVDTGIDEILYSTYHNPADPAMERLTIKEKFKSTLDLLFLNHQIPEEQKIKYLQRSLSNVEVKEVFGENKDLYFEYRNQKNLDALSLIIGSVATLTHNNVFFETASPSVEYINNLISVVYYNSYKVILMYPYTSEIDLLMERNISRAVEEGRILMRKDIGDKMLGCLRGYEDNIISRVNPNSLLNKNGTIVIVKYDTNIGADDYEKVKRFEDSNITILEEIVKIDGNIL